jgi:hypothetical protein
MSTKASKGVSRDILLSELDPSIESQIAWFHHMQETQPMRYRPEYNLWELFRYKDIQQVLLDHATFSIGHALPEGVPSGKQITVIGTNIYRIASGKIVEQRSDYDQLSLLQQLGLAPSI